MNRGTMPIKTWISWSIIALGAFLFLTWNYFVTGLTSDSSHISHLLLFFFGFGFLSSLRAAIYLQREFNGLSGFDGPDKRKGKSRSDIACLFTKAREHIEAGERLDLRNLITAYSAKLGVRTRNVTVVSGMLITIGLLGTVVGLIMTVNGLSTVLDAAGKDYDRLIAGMNETVLGMGTAFYTTFFGALLGGVVLRVLGSELEKSATQLSAEALELGELWLAPVVQAHTSETLAELEARVQSLFGSFDGLGGGIDRVVGIIDARQAALEESINRLAEDTQRAVADTLEKGLADLSDGFAAIAQSLEQGQQPLAESLGRLSEQLARSVEETRKQSDARLQMRATDIAQKLNVAAAMLESLCDPGADAA